VRIRNRGAALNFFDILQVQGQVPDQAAVSVHSGRRGRQAWVDAVGDGVTGCRTGDRVMGISRGRGFAEYSVVKASNVFYAARRHDLRAGRGRSDRVSHFVFRAAEAGPAC
jgi:NADPH:quinone reductase-like Zn-dependent oxidoreductase